MNLAWPSVELGGGAHQVRAGLHFPLECRFVRADDIWLSPAYGRDSAYIAAHMYRGMPYREYFAALEAIFLRVRAQLDPQGVFLNG